jgi:hypothetical protein
MCCGFFYAPTPKGANYIPIPNQLILPYLSIATKLVHGA